MKHLSIKDLNFSFEDPSGLEITVFNDVSLVIAPNRVYRLLGENGTGKTSFFKLIRGIYKAQRGVIEIPEGLKIFASDYQELPKDIKVKDYLSFYVGAPQEVVELLSLKAVLNLKISSLSTGEKQRLSLATLFCESFDLLILDESFKYIDAKQRMKIASAIEDRYSGRSTIIYVEHELQDIIKTTDYLTIMNKKIVSKTLDYNPVFEVERQIKLCSKKKHWFFPMIKSHYLIYSLFFTLLMIIQLSPVFLLTTKAPEKKIYASPAITLKSRSGDFSAALKNELSSFNSLGYSLEYAYKENSYYAFKSNSELDDNRCNTNSFGHDNFISFETIVSEASFYTLASYFYPIEGVQMTCQPLSFSAGRQKVFELSKSNYLKMMVIYNFFSRFDASITRSSSFPGTSNFFYISRIATKPIGGVGINEESADSALVLIDREKRNVNRLPIGTFDSNLEESLYSTNYDVVLSYELISQLVNDETHLSFEIRNSQDYKSIKKIANRHGLFIISNYKSGNTMDNNTLLIFGIIYSLSLIISLSYFGFTLKIEKRKYERLIISSLLIKRAQILTLLLMIVTIFTSILSSILVNPWFLLSIPIYAIFMVVALFYLHFVGVKYEKI